MKLLFDENISYRILSILPEEFSGSSHLKSEDLNNQPDIIIWEYAKVRNFVIVTQDSDFNDLNFYNGFPPKVIWIRMGNLRTMELCRILIESLAEINNFLSDSDSGILELFRMKKID